MKYILNGYEKTKDWFKDYLVVNGISFIELKNDIFPHSSPRTLEKLWQKGNRAPGGYADALMWFERYKKLKAKLDNCPTDDRS